MGSRNGIRPVKNRVVGCWRGYLSEQGADLHTAHTGGGTYSADTAIAVPLFSSRRKSGSLNDEYVSLVPIPLIHNASRPVGLHSVVSVVMEARRLSTSTSSCFTSVGPLFPFLRRGFPACWHLGMSECRHALAQPPGHPTPPHQQL